MSVLVRIFLVLSEIGIGSDAEEKQIKRDKDIKIPNSVDILWISGATEWASCKLVCFNLYKYCKYFVLLIMLNEAATK